MTDTLCSYKDAHRSRLRIRVPAQAHDAVGVDVMALNFVVVKDHRSSLKKLEVGSVVIYVPNRLRENGSQS